MTALVCDESAQKHILGAITLSASINVVETNMSVGELTSLPEPDDDE